MNGSVRDGKRSSKFLVYFIAVAVVAICATVFTAGLGGGFLFDDYPNIVDNKLVQPVSPSVSELTAAALSSPSSELKRPLASLSFAADFLANGLDPAAMKMTNIILHGLNGLLVFFLVRLLMHACPRAGIEERGIVVAALAATIWWMLAPINLTAVLYIVQRMESLANLFVLAGLIGYVHQRMAMLSRKASVFPAIAWIIVPAVLGCLAKETAVLLPLYALCVEAFIFNFRATGKAADRSIVWTFVLLLGLPFIAGSLWVAPGILDPHTWATRDFTLETRLLSEPRIVLSYASWVLIPLPSLLSFYHDNFVASSSLVTPWTTGASIVVLSSLLALAIFVRKRWPLCGLGIALFFAGQTLTGTVLPLELIYEHRNYFASLGLIMAAVEATVTISHLLRSHTSSSRRLLGYVPAAFVGALAVYSASVTMDTAKSWGTPLSLAQELARRAPDSPRAMYELGRAYIIASHYDPASPYVPKARDALEQAAGLPASSILPEQALIFLNSRMGTPIPGRWWLAMQQKLTKRPATVQDESSLITLSTCHAEGACIFPSAPLQQLFATALAHPAPTARLYFAYGQFANSALKDPDLTLRMTRLAVRQAENEPAYRETLVRLLASNGRFEEAIDELDALRQQNLQGRLDHDIAALSAEIALKRAHKGSDSR
jgi:hypothetical protein